MKNSLKLSVTLNVLLISATLWLYQARKSSSVAPVAQRGAALTSAPEVQIESRPQAQAGYESFRWSHIESTNYLVYIGNLRRIGCPEQTIRDLISADVDTLYAPRRAQMERQLPVHSPGLAAAQGTTALALQKLREEENALIENLLHPGARALSTEPVASQSASASYSQQDFDNVRTPAFMRPIGDKLEFTSDQSQAIDEVRQWFLNQVGGANQDPADPEYMRRWEKAQPQADGLLLGKLGLEAYLQYANAIRQSEASQNP